MAWPRGDIAKARRCPFCGNEDLQLVTIPGRDGYRTRFAVRCNYDDGGCGAEGGWRHDVDEAVACWNQRRRKWRNE